MLNVPNPVSDVCMLGETIVNKWVNLFKMEALADSVWVELTVKRRLVSDIINQQDAHSSSVVC